LRTSCAASATNLRTSVDGTQSDCGSPVDEQAAVDRRPPDQARLLGDAQS
jgi:hypothetical protein